MKIIIARNSGFCDGVKRAMGIAVAGAESHGSLAADGPLVHNRQALELLALRGVGLVSDDGDDRTTVLVRAHGAPPGERRRWREAGRAIVDATCPHVAANQRLAERAGRNGETVVLAGDADHAEVLAVAASAGPSCRVVSSLFDVASLDATGKILFMAQTTFGVELFAEMAAVMRRRFPECRVVDTICRATHRRQDEAERLAAVADILVVVGGRHSANTARLAEAAATGGRPVVSVETADELRPEDFAGHSVAAVISGASTPGWVIQAVVNRLRRLGRPTIFSRALALLGDLADSRVLPTLSALGLALAAQFHILGHLRPALALAGACYVFFAHTLNRRIPDDPRARRFSLSDVHYRRHRGILLPLAWLAGGLSLVLALAFGRAVLVVFAAVAAAAGYAWKNGGGRNVGAARRLIRHWPMALGWAVVLALPPALVGGRAILSAAGTAAFVFLIRFCGTLIRDLHDSASDSLMGIDTLPGRLGTARAGRLAVVGLSAAAVLPLAAALVMGIGGSGLTTSLLFLLLLPAAPAAGLAVLELMASRRLNDAVPVQAGADAMGVIAGLLALSCALGSP